MNTLFVCVLLGLCGAALSDGEGGDANAHPSEGGDLSSTSPRHCPLPPEEDVKTKRLNSLRDNVIECTFLINGKWLKQMIENGNTTHEVREAIGTYCKHASVAEECLTRTFALGEFCLNGTQNQILKSTGEGFLSFIRATCRDDGARLATIVSGIKQLKQANTTSAFITATEQCLNEVQDEAFHRDMKTYDPLVYSRIIYKFIKFQKDCFKERLTDHEEISSAAGNLLGDILTNIKCVSSEGGEVPCGSED